MRARLIAAAAIVPVLGGCVATRSLPDLTQSRGPCVDQEGGWCSFTRDLSVGAWPYAQLSSNAYCDHTEPFELPSGYNVVSRLPAQDVCDLERAAAKGDKAAGVRLKPIHKALSKLDTHGFNYTVYDKRSAAGALERRVIAFRGTDPRQVADWFYGNIGSTQCDQGLALYASERAKLDQSGGKGVPITVTGHSLGGAIAIQVSLAHPGVDAYVFNTSPRYQLVQPNANRRVAIAERGDLLEALRSRSMPVRQDLLIINCRPLGNNVTDHSVRKLAECVTWIAAPTDAGARSSVEANHIVQPEGEAENLLWGLPVAPAL
jgi:pimeloyl-ACP methyl ester carboxylesterase